MAIAEITIFFFFLLISRSFYSNCRDLETNIESIWLQVKSVIVSHLEKKNQELDGDSEMTLKQQITSLAKKESPVRQLMWKRLVAYVRLVKTGKLLPPAPPGYTDLNEELQLLATTFKRITVYNYSVFGEHCEKLLEQMSNDITNSSPSAASTSTTGGPPANDSPTKKSANE